MNEDVKALWVNRLIELDGKDRQAKGVLRRGDKMCCLGVLCEIAIEQGLDVVVADRGDGTGSLTYDNDPTYLPASVQIWAGIDKHNPFYVDEAGEDIYLAVLNDRGISFKEIAYHIEKEF